MRCEKANRYEFVRGQCQGYACLGLSYNSEHPTYRGVYVRTEEVSSGAVGVEDIQQESLVNDVNQTKCEDDIRWASWKRKKSREDA